MGNCGKEYAVQITGLPENIQAGITTCAFGDMSHYPQLENQKGQNNKLAGEFRAMRWLKLLPEHGDRINIVANNGRDLFAQKKASSGNILMNGSFYKGDGIIHFYQRKIEKKVILISPTADCPTVMIFNRNGDVSAIIHSGRKSTHLGIVPKALGLIEEYIGIVPEQLHVALVPGISWQNYQVSPEIAEEFNGTVKNGRYIDLKETILGQLSDAKVPESNISVLHDFCSFESQKNSKLFYSHRATGTNKRNAGFICS